MSLRWLGYQIIKFPGSAVEKLKAGIFDGRQIRTLIKDHNFPNFVNEKKLCAWSAFLEAVKNFWGNRKAVKYKEVVAKLLLQDMGANMSIKTNMLKIITC